MTHWPHSVSWSKLKLALDCPRQLQHTIDKTPHGRLETSPSAHLGKAVQLIFEHYFNQGVNLRPGGAKLSTILAVSDRVISYYLRTTHWEQPTDQEAFVLEAQRLASQGLEVMRGRGLLGKRVRAETKSNATFRGFRTFALIDFLAETRDGREQLYDGKGNREKNADPRQVQYYALNRLALGKTLTEAGFLYWQHDFEPVDVSPSALKNFADTELERARPIFELLKQGTTEPMETRPSATTCRFCNWRHLCPDSHYKPKETDATGLEETTFG